MADIFAVVADAHRRDLLAVLHRRAEPGGSASGEISVSELVAELALSQPTVSKHLKVLRDAGLVSVREKGQHRYYRLEAAPLSTIEDWVAQFATSDASTDAALPADSRTDAVPTTDAAPAAAAASSPTARGAKALAEFVGKCAADVRFRFSPAAGSVRRPRR